MWWHRPDVRHRLIQQRRSQMPISRFITIATAFAAVSVFAGASKLALAQQPTGDVIGELANNEGIFVDGKTFKIARGKGKGDPVAEVARMGAKEVGPGAIVFRYQDKLYMVEGTPEQSPQAMKNFQDNWNVSYMKAMTNFQDNWNVSFMKDFQDNWNVSFMKDKANEPYLQAMKNFQDNWNVSFLKDFQDNWNVSFMKNFQDNWNVSFMKGFQDRWNVSYINAAKDFQDN
jgi:hypothetical protein